MTLQHFSESDELAEQARTLLILSNYKWIKHEASKIGVDIIPIKGIDLLETIYNKNIDRHLNDIDILCHNEEDCIKLVNHLCQEEYRVEFPFATRPEVLASKKKISLLSCSTIKVNVDVHIAFVTKKFFSKTIGAFNIDAMNRCKNGRMDALDRWLFLAQHAAFHHFADYKWTKDLRIIYIGYSEEQIKELINTAVVYGFKRVTIAALYHIYKDEPNNLRNNLSSLNMSTADRYFLSFIRTYDRLSSHSILDRLVSAYWEFTFIDKSKDRLRSLLSLFFPSKGLLTNIYRINSARYIFLFYPLNFLVVSITSLSFGFHYAVVCALNGKS